MYFCNFLNVSQWPRTFFLNQSFRLIVILPFFFCWKSLFLTLFIRSYRNENISIDWRLAREIWHFSSAAESAMSTMVSEKRDCYGLPCHLFRALYRIYCISGQKHHRLFGRQFCNICYVCHGGCLCYESLEDARHFRTDRQFGGNDWKP